MIEHVCVSCSWRYVATKTAGICPACREEHCLPMEKCAVMMSPPLSPVPAITEWGSAVELGDEVSPAQRSTARAPAEPRGGSDMPDGTRAPRTLHAEAAA